MTPGRRPLRFSGFDRIMPDVERLLEGCATLGGWSLAQIIRHLTAALRVTADLPASTPQDPSKWIGRELKQRLFASGTLPEGYAAPPEVIPAGAIDARSEAESLRRAIAHYTESSGPVIPHPYLGPLTKAEWDRFHLMHCAHHLSFAVPKPT